jgi:hypothetical protein
MAERGDQMTRFLTVLLSVSGVAALPLAGCGDDSGHGTCPSSPPANGSPCTPDGFSCIQTCGVSCTCTGGLWVCHDSVCDGGDGTGPDADADADADADGDGETDADADGDAEPDGPHESFDAHADVDGGGCRCIGDADCYDGNACNGAETCHDCTCFAGTPLPNGEPCDDGDRCTAEDVCASGDCVGRNTCPCSFDDQCASYEDGDFCNGTLICVARDCVLDPLTIVTCDASADTDCLANHCVPSTGACVLSPVADGMTCSDGSACTAGDACTAGTCVGGSATCTCGTRTDCAAYEDGNACNGTLVCIGGTCVVDATTIVACDASGNTPCRVNRCVPSTGACVPVVRTDGALCDDDDPCTTDTFCAGGACIGERFSCDDSNPCTRDSCTTEPVGCMFTFDPAICDDGNVCTDDSCDFDAGCGHVANRLPCDDGNPCTGPDACDGLGTCVGTPTGRTNCSGVCVDVLTDPHNCGSCGAPCAPTEACVDGSCTSG